MHSADSDIEILSVSQLNAHVRDLLEENFPSVWIGGEISNLAMPSSGHMYFSLKDANAQVRCAFFRGKSRGLNFTPRDGIQVLVQANVSLYEGRGDFQLIINQMELAGAGALRRQFEILKEKLASEKLFDVAFKKPIPAIPESMGIITSATGAAIHDILITLKKRYPIASIIIYPCTVQGERAAKDIVSALQTANRRKECDVLILARGGGSLEDLCCFNDETVAREIFKSDIPVVSGIGHETDFTIADFVADVRAATPTAAALMVSPDQHEWLDQLRYHETRLIQFMRQFLKLTTLHLKNISRQIRHPGQIIREQIQTIDFLEQKLLAAIGQLLHLQNNNLKQTGLRFRLVSPEKKLLYLNEKIVLLHQRIRQLMQSVLKQKNQYLQHLAKSLNTVSPLATLERGYSISSDVLTSRVIRSIRDLEVGKEIDVRFRDGHAICRVDSLIKK